MGSGGFVVSCFIPGGARSASVAVSGTSSVSDPRPYWMRFAIRWMSTVVLPLPAPASSSSGPSVARTAFLCISFRFAKSASMKRLRACT